MIDIFTEAARDVMAERLAERCALAKVAVADVWTFLALASNPQEFDHRLALAEDRIAARVDPELLDVTLAALKDDFIELLALRDAEAQHESKTAAVAEVSEPPRPGEQIWHV